MRKLVILIEIKKGFNDNDIRIIVLLLLQQKHKFNFFCEGSGDNASAIFFNIFSSSMHPLMHVQPVMTVDDDRSGCSHRKIFWLPGYVGQLMTARIWSYSQKWSRGLRSYSQITFCECFLEHRIETGPTC